MGLLQRESERRGLPNHYTRKRQPLIQSAQYFPMDIQTHSHTCGSLVPHPDANEFHPEDDSHRTQPPSRVPPAREDGSRRPAVAQKEITRPRTCSQRRQGLPLATAGPRRRGRTHGSQKPATVVTAPCSLQIVLFYHNSLPSLLPQTQRESNNCAIARRHML